MLEVIYKIKCNVPSCDCESEQRHTLNIDNIHLPLPALPQGWHRLDFDWICEKHIVGVMDKI